MLKLTKEQRKDKIVALYKKGYTIYDIAKKMGISLQTVKGHCIRLNLDREKEELLIKYQK